MKIIQSGSVYTFHDDSIQTHNRLPAHTYSVSYDQRKGCFLTAHEDISVCEKAYGIQNEKVVKVMGSFEKSERSIGVILSGDKGIGKSMFAKKLCVKAMECGLPVILVEECVPGIAKFIESINQECIVLFDEFDKIFKSNSDEEDAQAKLLSLFDGTAGGKKLFIVTCNELYGLNDYIVNRPGRFHYHFRFEYPTSDDIKEYLTDKLDPKYYEEIPNVVGFSQKISLNYDCLRSIAFELNQGVSFKEAIADLNILNVSTESYNVVLHFENGMTLHHFRYNVNLFDNDRNYQWVTLYNDSGTSVADVKFDKGFVTFDALRNIVVINSDGLIMDYDDYDEDSKEVQIYKSLKPAYMTFAKCHNRSLHYNL